jgi:hypothetical protein
MSTGSVGALAVSPEQHAGEDAACCWAQALQWDERGCIARAGGNRYVGRYIQQAPTIRCGTPANTQHAQAAAKMGTHFKAVARH